MSFLDFVIEKADVVARIPFAKSALLLPYRAFQYLTVGRLARKKKKIFDKFCFELAQTFDECMNKNNYKYTLAYGSCLGAIREHGFIKHDDDLDVWMWIDDYDNNLISSLANYGFKLKKSYSLENDNLGKELTFEFKGVLIDIFFLYPIENGMAYSCIFNTFPDCVTKHQSIRVHGGLQPTKCILPICRDIIYVPFENFKMPVPSNADEIMRCRYGEDYMDPQPKWNKNIINKYHVLWEDKVAKYEEF